MTIYDEKEYNRSDAHRKLFPDDEMVRAFGKLNPTVAERTEYFYDMWLKRRGNQLNMAETAWVDDGFFRSDELQADILLKGLGLRDPWDYQIRNNIVRFEHKEDLAVFKIAWSR